MAVRRRVVRRKAAPADPNRDQKVAAAEAVCREIKVQSEAEYADTSGPNVVDHVKPYNYAFAVGLEASVPGGLEWRRLTLNQGHRLTWRGGVRPSAKGDLLFQFEPELNSMLEERKAKIVEVPHTQLEEAFGHFQEWITDMMGASPAELLAQAMHAIDEGDEAAAKESPPEEPQVVDESVMPEWGSWA